MKIDQECNDVTKRDKGQTHDEGQAFAMIQTY